MEHFLAHLPVFRGLTSDEIAELARLLKKERVADGQLICQEGAAGDAIFLVSSGSLVVSKKTAHGDEQILAELTGPTVTGEMALLDRAPRSASVRVKGSADVFRLDCKDFDALRSQYSRAAAKVVKNLALILCDRLRETNERIDAFFAAPEKSLADMRARQLQLWQARQKGTS